MDLDACVMRVDPPLWSHTEQVTVLDALGLPLSVRPDPQPLAPTDLTVPTVLPCPVGDTSLAAFSHWLLALRHVRPRFPQVSSWLHGSFLSSAK